MSNRYTQTAIILHWLIAICIFGMFALGWYMTDIPKDASKQIAYDLFDWGIYTWELTKEASPRSFYFNLHKSIGVTILGLVIIRFFWRLSHKPPTILSSYKTWERQFATAAHHLLYLLMFAIPLSGFIMSMASKYGIKWFGIKLLAGLDNKGLRETSYEVHEIAGLVILVIIALHILAALKHQLIDKDETMKRMM